MCDILNDRSKREAFKYVQNISHGLIVVQFRPRLTKACLASLNLGGYDLILWAPVFYGYSYLSKK